MELRERPKKFFKYRSMDAANQPWVERTVLHNEAYVASADRPPPWTTLHRCQTRRAPLIEATSVFGQAEPPLYIASSIKFEPHLSAAEREASADQAMIAMTSERIAETTALIQALHSEALATARGVFCVSAKHDDILMWSHYADHHRGICLEFDGGGKFAAHAQPVRYSKERVPINPYRDSADTMLEKAMLTKSSHWAYESEWRLLSYRSGPSVVQFRPENLTGIVIGAMASAATIDKVHAWSEARCNPLQIRRAFISTKKFALDIRP